MPLIGYPENTDHMTQLLIERVKRHRFFDASVAPVVRVCIHDLLYQFILQFRADSRPQHISHVALSEIITSSCKTFDDIAPMASTFTIRDILQGSNSEVRGSS